MQDSRDLAQVRDDPGGMITTTLKVAPKLRIGGAKNDLQCSRNLGRDSFAHDETRQRVGRVVNFPNYAITHTRTPPPSAPWDN